MNIQNILGTIRQILNLALPIIIGLAVIYFLWGLLSYITAGGDDEKRGKAKNTMIYGIIVLFVMVAVWGLVAVIANTFGIQTGGGPGGIPQLP